LTFHLKSDNIPIINILRRFTMSTKLNGKVAVVTGGAMGIGFGIVKRLAEEGANVLLTDFNEEALKEAVKKLGGKPGKVSGFQADVSEEGTGEKLVERCIKTFGGIDILVNNAGIYPQKPMLEMTPDIFDRVYRVNLKGLAFISKAVAAKMVELGTKGKIINIASIDAFHPSMIGLTAYDSSKGGVVMFTKSLALELGHYGITVNAIAPGGIQTEGAAKPLENSGMTEEQMKQMLNAFTARIPLGRMGLPDDIAKVAAFLASSDADYITGETIVVDGGMLLS
jgi:2-deoxy-D-gluconate 3-dehydrogenase